MARINLRGVGMPQMQVKLEGDWKRVTNALSNLQPALSNGYDIGATQAMKEVEKTVKKAIRSGAPPPNSGVYWQPLAASTIIRYGKHGIYRLTLAYYRSIKLQKTKKGRITVGVSTNMKHPLHKGLTIVQIANILENGNGRIPSRPLWAPSLKSVGGRPFIRSRILKSIKKELMRKGFRSNEIRITSW